MEILQRAVKELTEPSSYKNLIHENQEGKPLPSGAVLQEVVDTARSILFPGYYGRSNVNPATMHYHIGVQMEHLHELVASQIKAAMEMGNEGEEDTCMRRPGRHTQNSEHLEPLETGNEPLEPLKRENEHPEPLSLRLATEFIGRMPEVRRMLATDVVAAFNGDPAAKDYGEIISCYPVIKCLTNYRIAHELLKLGVPLIPRMLTEMAHSETGIDIHPGAQIGEYFTIDHGTGVVIGETCIIGRNVKLYQGVTLGAKSFPLDDEGNPIKGIPRHPILEDDVIVYSNASILGRIRIGKGAVIGGNIWVTHDVEPGSSITQRG